MKNQNTKLFEQDMNKTFQHGYFTNIIKNSNGMELFLPNIMDEHRGNLIATFLRNKYQIQALYFVKSKSIKVFYDKQ